MLPIENLTLSTGTYLVLISAITKDNENITQQSSNLQTIAKIIIQK